MAGIIPKEGKIQTTNQLKPRLAVQEDRCPQALKDAKALITAGKVSEEQINRMAKSISRTCIATGFYDTPQSIDKDEYQMYHYTTFKNKVFYLDGSEIRQR